MSTLTERVARAMCRASEDAEPGECLCERSDVACYWQDHRVGAAAAIREVLADMRQPSSGVRHMVRNIVETQVGPIPLDASVRLVIEELVDAVARENGLATPPAEWPQP